MAKNLYVYNRSTTYVCRDLDPYVNYEISFLLSFIGEINGKVHN